MRSATWEGMSLSTHAFELDLAAFLVERAPVLVRCDGPLQLEHIGECWAATAQRAARWSERLALLEEAPSLHRSTEAAALVEEILLAEPLARVLNAVIAARQQRRELKSLTAAFGNSLHAEEEARNRATGLVLRGRLLPMEQALRLHRLRRTSQRVSDLLIAALITRYPVARFACCVHRAEHLAEHMAEQLPPPSWSRVVGAASFAARWFARTLPRRWSASPAGPDDEVLRAVLRCLPVDLLDSAPATMTVRRLALLEAGDQWVDRLPWQDERSPQPQPAARDWQGGLHRR